MCTHPTTQALLRASADLVRHCQARPTDTRGIRRLRGAQAAATTAWLNEGCPDLEDEAKPIPPKVLKRSAASEVREGESKDWTPFDTCLEVVKLRDKSALVDDGDVTCWVPRKLIWELNSSSIPLQDLEAGGLYDCSLPVWLAKEKGLT